MGKNCDIIWYDTLDSTNDEAARQCSSVDNMSVIAARCQTAGRGQRGNRWLSRAGDNLTFSVVMRFGEPPLGHLEASRQFAVSEAAALAVTGFLSLHGIGAMIKWPNDVYVGDRKICGILIEHKIRGAEVSASIVGTGLNLNQTEFSPDIPNPVSMKMLTGESLVPEDALEEFAGIFSSLAEMTCSEEGREHLRSRYLSALYRKDELHSYTDCLTGTGFDGIIRGIGEDARLKMEIPGKGIRYFAFKEIAYSI